MEFCDYDDCDEIKYIDITQQTTKKINCIQVTAPILTFSAEITRLL